ncbi:MAG: potassium channel protein [Cyanobacteria bacterium J06638_22]
MNTSFRRILIGGIFFGTTILVAVTGYMVAGWSLFDSIYMVIITVFGVGYGEVRPIESNMLRFFTILVIIAGTSAAVYTVGAVVQSFTEGEINRALGIRRMMKAIENLQDHVIICGFGRMGQILAHELHEGQQMFVIIDRDGDRATEATELGYLMLTGDATDEDVLRLAGIDRARILTTVLPSDASNVFITLTARGMNPDLVILSRGEFPTTEQKLRLAGADHVVLPATIGAHRIVHMIRHPAALSFLDRNDGSSTLNELLNRLDVQIDELVIPRNSSLVGAMVRDVELQGDTAYLIVALRRADGTTFTHPANQTVLKGGDTIILMGHRGDIPKLAAHHSLRRQMRYRGARH